MKEVAAEIARLRSEVKSLRTKRFKHTAILALLEDVFTSLKVYLPAAKVSEKKNKWVYNSGIREIPLIMVERVHGSRDAVPVTWRSKQLNAIEDILNLIESQLREEL